MTTNKRKKVVKYRASTTHGGGHRKKRRGAGNRGGRGRAGSGKRGKARKQSFEKLGKRGFTPRRTVKNTKAINLEQLDFLLQNNKILPREGIIDLTSLGYHKLLGSGNLNHKVKIRIKQYSRKAEEKVKANGSSFAGKKEESAKQPLGQDSKE